MTIITYIEDVGIALTELYINTEIKYKMKKLKFEIEMYHWEKAEWSKEYIYDKWTWHKIGFSQKKKIEAGLKVNM